MENSVSVFALGSIFFGLKAIKTQNKTFVWWILSSLFVFFASFSKGIPGLFTISFPIIYWLTTQNISFKKSLLFTLLLMLLPIIIYGLFIAIPLSRESLSIYFFDRLLTRTNSMPTANYRFEILVRLYYELLPVIILAVIILISGGIKRIKATVKENLRYFLLFLGLGVAGTFPLTLTMVQKGFYMVPAFPFFALAFAALIGPLVAIKVNQINVGKASYKLFFAFSIMVFLVIGMITFLNRNKIEREETIITDVYKIGSEVPKFSTVTVPEEMYDEYDFVLQGYLVRYFNISISPYKMYDYFLKEKSLDTQIPENYLKLDLELSKYQLYKKVD